MTPTWTLFNSYYIIFIRIYRSSIFLWSDNLHESRLGITYPVAFISSPNWRTQQQKAKKRDIFAFCFEREHSWLFRYIYIYMLNTRYIYFVLLIKGSRMNHFYFTIVTYKEYKAKLSFGFDFAWAIAREFRPESIAAPIHNELAALWRAP